jgi:hypothetical protein
LNRLFGFKVIEAVRRVALLGFAGGQEIWFTGPVGLPKLF